MTGTIRSPHIQKLFTLAARDEAALQFPLPEAILGFHAQQSCEKLLKAWLTGCGKRYPFTHELATLVHMLHECGEELPDLPYLLQGLEPFGVESRYDLRQPLTDEEITGIRATVVVLREHALSECLHSVGELMSLG